MTTSWDLLWSQPFGMACDLVVENRKLKKHNADLAAERDELWMRCGKLERENADLRFQLSPLGRES